MSNQTNTLPEFEISRPDFLGGGLWRLKNFTSITVIFGKNGSGKSWLLRNLRNSDRKKFHYCAPERAGNISFEPQYMNAQYNADQRANQTAQNQAPNYIQQVIARIQVFLSKRGASRSQEDSKELDFIEQSIHYLLHDFEFHITGENPPFTLTRLSGEKIENSNQISSGETQIL